MIQESLASAFCPPAVQFSARAESVLLPCLPSIPISSLIDLKLTESIFH